MRVAFLLLLFTGANIFADSPRSMFEPGKHCVAYKVKKKSLALFSGQVVGVSCDISAQMLPMVGGGYQIEVSIPIGSFDSGDKDRDQDVKNVLKEAEQSNILFRSKPMSEQEWKDLAKKSSVVLEGELNIAGKSYPISAPCQITKVKSGVEIDGVAVVPFNKFDLQPPKVGGGLIAKADSDLELHFHLLSEKILGADKFAAATVAPEAAMPTLPDVALPPLPEAAPSPTPSPEQKKEPPKESELHL